MQALLLALAILFAQVTADRAARGASRAAATASVPDTWRSRVRISHADDRVSVTLRAPAVVPGTGRFLVVRASSEATR